jgi:hypothetical protein
VPTGAKVGIDATIGEGIPHERFERIAYAYADRREARDYLKGKADARRARRRRRRERDRESCGKIAAFIEKEPKYYQEIAGHFATYDFQASPARPASSTRSRSCGRTRGTHVPARLAFRGQAAAQRAKA